MQKYIKNKKLFNKFNKAFIEGKLILINGATGVGKTAFIEEALKDEDYCYFSIKENYESITCNKDICVIDDFQYIIDKEYLLKEIVYIANTVKHAIIISRSNMSEYFMDAIATKGILTIGEKDLFFNEEMLYELFDNSISKEEMEIFFKNSMGFPLITLHLANKVKEGSPLTPELLSQSQTVYIQRLKTAVFDNINPEVLNFLLQVSVVDEFNIELAVAITLNNRSKHLVSKAAK